MPQAKKPGRRRVKSGCLTCKIRKVKCDETRPVCSRCKTTGRTCDGYGVWGGGGNSYSDRYRTTPSKSMVCSSPEPPLRSNISCVEGQCMQWLHSKIIHGDFGFFDTTFWTDVVMPATWSVPAVAHAVEALGAAVRDVAPKRPGLSYTQEQYTLGQYTKAIRHLQPLLFDRNNTSTTIVLITCLLFTFLEYLRGQYKAAALHLHNGLKFLKDIHFDEADLLHGLLFIKPVKYKRAIHRAIFRGFATLHVQADLFGNHVPNVPLLLQTTDDEMPSPTFPNLAEAQDSLDKLVHGMLIVKHRVEATFAVAGDLSFSLIESREIGLCRLKTWQATYDTTLQHLSKSSARTRLAYTLLLNYHTMAKIMCTCMVSTSELAYRSHMSDFLSIIRRSFEFWSWHVASHNTATSSGPTSETGWISPLYFTALKCRVPRVRRHAIKLLRSMPRREGVWDSTLAANVSDKVYSLEKNYSLDGNVAEPDFGLHDIPKLTEMDNESSCAEAHLFHEVQIELSETSNITITCKRRQHFQPSKDMQCHFDGNKWHDLSPTIRDIQSNDQTTNNYPTPPTP